MHGINTNFRMITISGRGERIQEGTQGREFDCFAIFYY